MEIEYDIVYKQYVVWEKQGNCKIEVFKSKRKKDCKEYINKKICK